MFEYFIIEIIEIYAFFFLFETIRIQKDVVCTHKWCPLLFLLFFETARLLLITSFRQRRTDTVESVLSYANVATLRSGLDLLISSIRLSYLEYFVEYIRSIYMCVCAWVYTYNIYVYIYWSCICVYIVCMCMFIIWFSSTYVFENNIWILVKYF